MVALVVATGWRLSGDGVGGGEGMAIVSWGWSVGLVGLGGWSCLGGIASFVSSFVVGVFGAVLFVSCGAGLTEGMGKCFHFNNNISAINNKE